MGTLTRAEVRPLRKASGRIIIHGDTGLIELSAPKVDLLTMLEDAVKDDTVRFTIKLPPGEVTHLLEKTRAIPDRRTR